MKKSTKSSKKTSKPSPQKVSPISNQSTWKTYLPLLLLLICFVAVYSYIFDSKLSLNGDNASYYLLGKSLSKGLGYNLYNDIWERPHGHFPPGYPILLAAAMIFSKKIIFLKIVNGLFLLASLILCFQIFKKLGWSWQVALIGNLFLLMNYHVVGFSTVLMSEVPFLFFSLLSFYWLLKIDIQNFRWHSKSYLYFLFSLSFAFHIRTIGVALLAGTILYLLIERKWKIAGLTFSGFVLLAIPWILRGKLLGLSSSYHSVLFQVNTYRPELGTMGWGDLVTRITKNVVRYCTNEIPSSLFPFIEVNYKVSPDAQAWCLGLSLILLILFGLYKSPKYRMLLLGYLGGTMGILLLWPEYWFGTRFIVVVLPFMVGLILFAISTLLNLIGQRLKLPKAHWLLFLVLPLLSSYIRPYEENQDRDWQSFPLKRLHLKAKQEQPPRWKNYKLVGEYCKKHLKNSDIIACRKPQLFHIFSDRYTASFPNELDHKAFMDNLVRQKVSYVIVEQLGFSSTGRYLVPVVQQNPKNFKIVYHLKNPDTYLVKFIPPTN